MGKSGQSAFRRVKASVLAAMNQYVVIYGIIEFTPVRAGPPDMALHITRSNK
jgi:hypothetical protein